MKKKKIKKALSIIEESSLGKIGKHLGQVQVRVKKHSSKNQHSSLGLLECENDLLKCYDCFYKDDMTIECEWLKENNCTFKCTKYIRSVLGIGYADINRIKHHIITKDENLFRQKVGKYIKFAEQIDSIYEEEMEKIREKKRKELIRQRIQELKEMQELEKNIEPDIKQKRRNIKSLI